RWRLFARAMNVGRSHIAATVNTLALAYVGASLPLLVLFAAGRQDPLLTASGEVVAVEIGKAIVGSIGIVAAVPLTTAIAVILTGRSLPLLGDGGTVRRAQGWERRSRNRRRNS
ncbi:MAG: YibE/F family protein, partial [Chloroflexota bacterium]|nr:YibE/F family protein [Chloroflexota bacterium]